MNKAPAVEINVIKGYEGSLNLQFTTPIGFMKIRNANNNYPTGLYIKHKDSGRSFIIYPNGNVGNSNPVGFYPSYNTVVNDIDNPGQQVRRLKVNFPFPLRVAGRAGFPSGKNQYDVYITNANGSIISDAAQTVSEESMPVEFSGGNGEPLKIYLEFSSHFDFKEKAISNVDKIYLSLTSKSFSVPNIKTDIPASPLAAYDQTGHIFTTFAGKKPTNSYLTSDKNSLLIQAITVYDGDFEQSEYRKKYTQIGFLPRVIITNEIFNQAKPKSGWYDISLQAQNLNYKGRRNLSLSSRYLLNDKPIFDKTPISSEITDLITQVNTKDGNRYFEPKKLSNDVFHHQRFYIVSSYDSQGRIRLQPIESRHGNATHPAFTLHLEDIADGDIVWYGSSVRWFSAGKGNELIVRDGYLGWHDPGGKYAFLKLHNGQLAKGEAAPKVGTVFTFNWAKLSQ